MGKTLLLACALLLAAWAGLAQAQAVHQPKKGSAERAAVLDALRPAVEAQMRGPVEFVVATLRTTPKWAFVQVDPQRPGGAPINVEDTSFSGDADMMDGLTVFALLRFQSGRWNLVEHVVGPTDVAYLDWADRFGAPPVILGLE
ncbi:hypothetical protein AX760_14300 [Pararhizobium antarcticum]|uniref:Uncharacterized protein n=1 Tax=Pararhizobium antarcticum TaxID=1798805 RepID=A0A657LVP5_9HYPH|nr:hypothetical protein AX760_14300 [Pararhizobium antarcticum]OJG01318.1 hypothetical protein AX761_00110 [Rhizobium sp. 58]